MLFCVSRSFPTFLLILLCLFSSIFSFAFFFFLGLIFLSYSLRDSRQNLIISRETHFCWNRRSKRFFGCAYLWFTSTKGKWKFSFFRLLIFGFNLEQVFQKLPPFFRSTFSLMNRYSVFVAAWFWEFLDFSCLLSIRPNLESRVKMNYILVYVYLLTSKFNIVICAVTFESYGMNLSLRNCNYWLTDCSCLTRKFMNGQLHSISHVFERKFHFWRVDKLLKT